MTGSAVEFRNTPERLQDSVRFLLARIDASFDLCLACIWSRDQSLQIPASDDMIRRMDESFWSVQCNFAATVRNVGLTDSEIVEMIEEWRAKN